MKIVGDQLVEWARLQREQYSKNLFGRSAYNRFYYAAYLVTRENLGELDPKWRRERHSSIPNVLVTTVRAPVKRELTKMARNGLITRGQMATALDSIKFATAELSNLLLQAYDIRCVADYEPEVEVVDDNNVLLLRNYKLNAAREWPGKAEAYCKTIRRIWRDAGLG